MRGDNDNQIPGRTAVFLPSVRAMILPAAGGCAALAVILAGSAWAGASSSLLWALCVWFGLPLVMAHAVLRALTLRVRVTGNAVFVHRGFPVTAPAEIDSRSIRLVRVVPGRVRILGGATLVLDLVDGRRVRAADLMHPQQAANAIRRSVRLAESAARAPSAGPRLVAARL